MTDFTEIARAVGTSMGYVRNIEYDIRTNGGMTRAQERKREKNPECAAQQYRRWKEKNPEKYAAIKTREFDDTFAHQKRECYTKIESEEILIGAEEDDAALAKKLGRTIHAIQNKRYHLRKAGMQISP